MNISCPYLITLHLSKNFSRGLIELEKTREDLILKKEFNIVYYKESENLYNVSFFVDWGSLFPIPMFKKNFTVFSGTLNMEDISNINLNWMFCRLVQNSKKIGNCSFSIERNNNPQYTFKPNNNNNNNSTLYIPEGIVLLKKGSLRHLQDDYIVRTCK